MDEAVRRIRTLVLVLGSCLFMSRETELSRYSRCIVVTILITPLDCTCNDEAVRLY